MRTCFFRAFVAAATALWLAGCNTTNPTASSFGPVLTPGAEAQASAPPPDAKETTGSVSPGAPRSSEDVAQGKQQYRAGKFDVAARFFSHAVERNPRDGEAWLGLAASYDRLGQFELADSAYAQAVVIEGPTAEVLNNQGYSYLLRGDLKNARAKLLAAQRKEPGNKYVQNNLALLTDAANKHAKVQ